MRPVYSSFTPSKFLHSTSAEIMPISFFTSEGYIFHIKQNRQHTISTNIAQRSGKNRRQVRLLTLSMSKQS
ncbi:hypothetical protein Q1695_012365 [Nippostrongylus brasiliensis]|nr:hypothetical protein Q1695_012365 [Nippostrongylus brasiliensis]